MKVTPATIIGVVKSGINIAVQATEDRPTRAAIRQTLRSLCLRQGERSVANLRRESLNQIGGDGTINQQT